ncbi:hypothetical protein IJG21_01605 [Candidatus Saccharibacteria bacterium]|nr:hypothetical protein [Candidatus Saccharibacteria bacterium]
MKKKGTKKGFTLIELSFAILFISTLLLTLTLIASEIISIYRKGYAIKTVNSVGRDLIDDFSASLSGINPGKLSSLCEGHYSDTSNDGYNNCMAGTAPGMKFIYQQFTERIKVKTSSGSIETKDYPYGGIFCTGKYSYIYKTGFLKNTEYYNPDTSSGSYVNNIIFTYKASDGSAQEKTNFSLLKIDDPKRLLCSNNLSDDYNTEQNIKSGSNSQLIELPESEQLSEEPVELLSKSDTELALFNFYIAPPAQTSSTGKTLYSASFILATVSGGVDIMTNENYCTAPMTYGSDFSYCAINKFNFSIQANGGGKK